MHLFRQARLKAGLLLCYPGNRSKTTINLRVLLETLPLLAECFILGCYS
jgi:hypothetical protein